MAEEKTPEQIAKEQADLKAKQSAEQAIVPPPPQFIQDTIKEARKEETTPDEDMKLLKELSQSDAWKILKKFIRNKQNRLQSMTAQAVRADSFNLQNVGFRYLIFDQVKEALEDVVRKVEQPAKIAQIEHSFAEGGDEDDAHS